MQKILSLLVPILALLFLIGTFFLQYEFLFVTRIILIVFSILYIVIDIKRDYFIENKQVFVFISMMSMISVAVSVLLDLTVEDSVFNSRDFFIPLYVFVLIVIMYKDLYDTKKK
ncbi:uncharacterized membrane protein YoaK (UPF0700 family) [Jeotgalibacillus terrae]|uniref:Permease n=1 Tax=Jeotgalibacillus terrae TaxID=587735 RepID=A0ABW5ZJG1_9BACL|nr:hypothetical protein [Jeotgalibacillus terrae]MBM7578562.1 uncharacterized membrane protein YoaK (UPF0700 family) [Jeotgalibacillus terrae]